MPSGDRVVNTKVKFMQPRKRNGFFFHSFQGISGGFLCTSVGRTVDGRDVFPFCGSVR